MSETESWKQDSNSLKRVVGGGENFSNKTRDSLLKLKLG
jgi:hypothetical protein